MARAFTPGPRSRRRRQAWGGERLCIDGEPVGELTSAGYRLRAGRSIGLGYVRGAAARRNHVGNAIAVDLWGERVPATVPGRLAAAPLSSRLARGRAAAPPCP